ncbi:MAG: prolyl oligopeptidase family serine peptidase [Pirellulales bacterium]
MKTTQAFNGFVWLIALQLALAFPFIQNASGQEATKEVSQKRTSEIKAELLKQMAELSVGQKFKARDTLDCGVESSEDAAECLKGLTWEAAEFEVFLEDGNASEGNERLVRFASPKPLGNAVNDLVAMEWHIARDGSGKPKQAPAMVVVHESGSGMNVGRIVARGLAAHGMHTFMLQMPSYGVRRTKQEREATSFLPSLKQAIADVRRARDAVSALPLVDTTMVGVQGTSLGGFVTATVSGLDAGFQRNFILLAGGNLHEVIFSGQKDAAKVRERLEKAGATREQIIDHARQIEPLRLAHRVRPEVTWLWSGKFDDVVPPPSSFAFAKAAKLPADHHIEMPANHYSGIIFLPKVLDDMAKEMGVEK